MGISDSENERQALDRYFERLSPKSWTAKHVAIALVALSVFLVTGFFFPGLSYVSVVMFGFPASAVVLGAYIAWLLLRRISRTLADACGVAFLMPVAICLIAVGSGRPDITLLTLLPSGLLWAVLRAMSRRHAAH